MSNYNETADNLKRLSVLFQSLPAAAEAFERLGSVEQATAEATRASDAARAIQLELQAAVDAEQVALDALKAQSAEVTRATQERVDKLIAKADERMNADLVAAQAKADEIIANANSAAAAMMAKNKDAQAEAEGMLFEIKISIAAAEQSWHDAEAAATDAEGRVIAAKREIQRLLSGSAE